MSLSIYLKGDYEELCGFGRRKNKANSKPIDYRSVCCVQRTACGFLPEFMPAKAGAGMTNKKNRVYLR